MNEKANPPLHVLFVTGIFPPDIGGPATYIPNMAAALLKRGHCVAVVTLSETPTQKEEIYPYPVVRIRRKLFKPFRFVRTVAAVVREGRSADLLFVHGLYPEAVAANFFLRRPQVQKWVGDWAWERATNKGWSKSSFAEFQFGWHGVKAEWLKAVRNFCVRRANTVIVPSRYLAGTLARWGVARERVKPVYNSIEIAPVIPMSVPLSTQFKLVTVGRLIALKQVDRIMRVIEHRQDLGLVIVGDGPERDRLEALARAQGLGQRVYFAGQKNREESLALMAGCDLFVLNSTHEGFPHVVLEAMSLGLPVVATAVGGIPELVSDGENGVLISPTSENELAKVVERLVGSPAERARLADGARRTVEHFRNSTMIEQTEAALLHSGEKPVAARHNAAAVGQHANL